MNSAKPPTTPAIMIQGTGSDVGKSVIVAGLCRLFANRGIAVAPFKPQNMSNNAAVTIESTEIGRAQWLQAVAARLPPRADMNPVLIKPESDRRSEVIVCGKSWGRPDAADFIARRGSLLGEVLASYARLAADADLVIIEGAGSPAETNLRRGDIANMGFAEAADVPVALVGDIDRGGVIASLVGTHAVLPPAERDRIVGFIINRFRGDVSLFDDGLVDIDERTGWPSFGVVPWFHDIRRLPSEDTLAAVHRSPVVDAKLRVAVPILSRIANFDDLDPLIEEPAVDVVFVEPGRPLPRNADVVILTGTKSTVGDLAFLREQGWNIDIHAHVRAGGRVLGLCGGFQMLGVEVTDADGVDGAPATAAGLGLLDIQTDMSGEKVVREAAGESVAFGVPVRGYEIHRGRTRGAALERPMLRMEGGKGKSDAGRAPAHPEIRPETGPEFHDDGARSADGRVEGCYLHGLLQNDAFRAAWLASIRPGAESGNAHNEQIDLILDRLADHLAKSIDVDRILEITQGWNRRNRK